MRCAECGEIWHQMPANEANSLFVPSGKGKNPSGPEGHFQQNGEHDGVDTRNVANLQKPKIDRSIHAVSRTKNKNSTDDKTNDQSRDDKTNDQSRVEGSHSGWFGWLILIVVLCGLCGGGYVYRVKIVEFWPPAATLFKIIGLDPENVGLVIQNISWAYENENDKATLVVVGEVINYSQNSQSVPHLLVAILDDRNRHLFEWTTAPTKNHLRSGQATSFSTRLADPPVGAKSIVVTFQVQK